jgi:hypothetical protein
MNAQQFKAAWARLKKETGLTSGQLAGVIGYGRAQPRRWESGAAPVPKLVGFVVEKLLAGEIELDELRRYQRKEPR